MKRPNGDFNQLLRTAEAGARFTINDVNPQPPPQPETQLDPESEAYLAKLLVGLRGGRRSVLIVENTEKETLGYLFSNVSRAGALSMLGKVIEASARRLDEGGAAA